MDHEYDQHRKHSRAAAASHNDAAEPGQSSRSAQLRRPEQPIASGLVQRKASGARDVSATAAPRAENKTGLPDDLKSGIESLSGISMDNVKVHYNSSQPAQLHALAYAQGSDIHVGPGQEQHLPHEAWHVVQQAQGRVTSTRQMKQGMPVNDDASLEHEADVMGARALSLPASAHAERGTAPATSGTAAGSPVVQRLKGREGTAQAGKRVEFTLAADFINNHVANSLEDARQVTEARVKSGNPPGIAAGTAANHVAPEAAWRTAIENSKAVVPPKDDWDGSYGDHKQFDPQLAKVEVQGWEAQGTEDKVVARDATLKKFVGGHWEVENCEFDDEENYKDGSGHVTMDISHLTS